MTRKEAGRNKRSAIANGEATYQGAPCNHGHSGTRMIRYRDHTSRTLKYFGRCVDCYAEEKDPSTLAGKASRQYRLDNKRDFMWRGARARARRHGREFTITKEDIIIPERCPISLKPLAPGTIHTPSLDRIDTSRGYTPDNIWVISNRINQAKNNLTIEEIKRLHDLTQLLS